jgi:NADH:ubiquinone oxidoreductase subunit F (NADH-binding)
METLCPATVKAPVRLCVLTLALTVQGALLPEMDIDAQLTFDAVDTCGQSTGTGVIVIVPEAPGGSALILFVLNP